MKTSTRGDSPVSETPCSSFFAQFKAAIAHAENTERELADQKFRNSQLETVLKIMARRNNGNLLWTPLELAAAVEDDRCIMLGALDMDLFCDTNASVETFPPESLETPLLVGLVSNHLPGAGCMCSAWNDSECGCANVDWRPRREVALEKALEYCLKKLKAHHLSRTGIPETIRNTEAIRDAGTRQPNAIGHA